MSAGALLSILLDSAKLPRNTDPESIFERVLEAVDRRDSAPMEGRWLGRKDLLPMTVSASFSDAG